jgi:hypothetical protein
LGSEQNQWKLGEESFIIVNTALSMKDKEKESIVILPSFALSNREGWAKHLITIQSNRYKNEKNFILITVRFYLKSLFSPFINSSSQFLSAE